MKFKLNDIIKDKKTNIEFSVMKIEGNKYTLLDIKGEKIILPCKYVDGAFNFVEHWNNYR
jgi:hypothetical protein